MVLSKTLSKKELQCTCLVEWSLQDASLGATAEPHSLLLLLLNDRAPMAATCYLPNKTELFLEIQKLQHPEMGSQHLEDARFRLTYMFNQC